MENPRTESARAHDDSDLIESMEEAPSGHTSSGGNMQRDIATQAELAEVTDPEAHVRVGKSAAVDHGEAHPASRGPDR